MTRVYGARDLTEAEFVKGLLESEEIPAVVQGGALQAVLGEVPVNPASLPSIWVNEPDEPRAMRIIDEVKRGGRPADRALPNWTCPRCGEKMEGQFSQCWHCGSDREGNIDPAFEPAIAFHPQCEHCGYLLIGLTSDRCPECGSPFDRTKKDTPRHNPEIL